MKMGLTCRIVTTSVKDEHLDVLWGEIGRFLATSAHPLMHTKGGPLVVNHHEIRRAGEMDAKNPLNYLKGQVSLKGEGMAGHHSEASLIVGDECCHDDRTDVLTDSGWKRFSELNGSELFLSMRSDRLASYLPATKIHASHRKGVMHLYEQRCGNFCVTPNHNMLWRKTKDFWIPGTGKKRWKWTDYFFEEIQGLNGQARSVPRTFVWEGKEEKDYELPRMTTERKWYPAEKVEMDLWLEFLGWYLSEGNLVFNGDFPSGVNISQKDVAVLHRVAEITKKMGFSPRVYESGSCVRINEYRLASHMLECGRYSYEKRVPRFVMRLPPRQIEIFIKAYKDGDGCDNGDAGREIIFTSSPGMADDLQELSYLAGRESTIHKRAMIGWEAPNGTARHDGFVVARSRPDLDSHMKVKRENMSVVDYDGMVYCVTVPPYHTIFTRRNGVCMWGGNSGLDDVVREMAQGWAKRLFWFGNPNQPINRFFQEAVDAGDLAA